MPDSIVGVIIKLYDEKLVFNVHSVPARWFPLENTRVVQSTETLSYLLTHVVLYTAMYCVVWEGNFSFSGISFGKFMNSLRPILCSYFSPSVIVSAKSRVK